MVSINKELISFQNALAPTSALLRTGLKDILWFQKSLRATQHCTRAAGWLGLC